MENSYQTNYSALSAHATTHVSIFFFCETCRNAIKARLVARLAYVYSWPTVIATTKTAYGCSWKQNQVAGLLSMPSRFSGYLAIGHNR